MGVSIKVQQIYQHWASHLPQVLLPLLKCFPRALQDYAEKQTIKGQLAIKGKPAMYYIFHPCAVHLTALPQAAIPAAKAELPPCSLDLHCFHAKEAEGLQSLETWPLILSFWKLISTELCVSNPRPCVMKAAAAKEAGELIDREPQRQES